jgi:hypothetical protein
VQAPWTGWHHSAACVCMQAEVGWSGGPWRASAAWPFSASLHRPKPCLASCMARECSRVQWRERCPACLLACRDRSDLTCRVPHLSSAIPTSCNILKTPPPPPDHPSPSPSPSAPRALIYPSPSALPRPTAHRPKGSTDHEPPLLPGLINTDLPSPVPAPPCQLDPSAPGLPSTTITGRPSACPPPLLTRAASASVFVERNPA